MNDNRNLFTHMRTDHNAWKHSLIGLVIAIVCLNAYAVLGGSVWLIAAFLVPFVAGVCIETIQWLERGAFQIKEHESIYDVLTTWLWFLYPIAVFMENK